MLLRQKRWYGIIVNNAPIDKLFTPYDHMHKYSVSERLVPEGYIVSGVNLDGMFNSMFVPDRIEQREYESDRFTDSETDDEPIAVMRDVVIRGGWFVPHAEFPNYRNYITTLRTAASVHQPRSLFETAACVVNSRCHNVYLPKIIKNKLKEYK